MGALDWNVSRRPCAAPAGVTKHEHRLAEGWYTPKQRRSKVIDRLYKVAPRGGLFAYRTVMMRPRPRGLADYQFWLLVLAHELIHVLGFRTGTFRWGPGWGTPSWSQETQWTAGSVSSDSEERVAELGAELLMDRLGVAVRDPSWRQVLGDPSPEEVDLAVQRVAFLP